MIFEFIALNTLLRSYISASVTFDDFSESAPTVIAAISGTKVFFSDLLEHIKTLTTQGMKVYCNDSQSSHREYEKVRIVTNMRNEMRSQNWRLTRWNGTFDYLFVTLNTTGLNRVKRKASP